MTKRIIALICALFMLLPMVVSCANTDDPEVSGDEQQTQAPGGNSATTTAPVEEETTGYQPPELKDMNGYVYRNLVATNEMWYPVFFAPNGEEVEFGTENIYIKLEKA